MVTFIQRNSIREINKHLESKEITMLVGPRQAGKTTIMLHIKEQLDKRGAKTASRKKDKNPLAHAQREEDSHLGIGLQAGD